jgi:hypothetical protein
MWRKNSIGRRRAFGGHPSSTTGRKNFALILQGRLVSQLTRQLVS